MSHFNRQAVIGTLVGIVGFWVPGFGQFMQDNAPDGNSSLIGGTSIGFDVQKTTLQVDYTGKIRKPGSLNWGASLSGGNSNRLAQLLQHGSFVPSARISGFVFRNWDVNRKKTNDLKDVLLSSSKAVATFREGQKAWFDKHLKAELVREIKKLPNVAPTTHATLEALYTNRINAGITFVRKAYKQVQDAAPLAVKPLLDPLLDLIDDRIGTFNTQPSLLALEAVAKADSQRYFTFQKLNPVRRFLVYGRAGVAATGFSYFPGINAADIAGSFRDSLFTSPYVELGGNFYTRGYIIMGLNVGYGRVNTLQNVSPVTYTYQRVINGAGGQQLTSEQEIQAYAGTPTQYGQFRVKADFIGLIPTGDRGTLALNPYLRFSTSATPQNRWRYGVAGYYFNRKGGFMGGLYAERTYIVTQLSANTFTTETKGISLGIRASYLLDTIFNTEKPR
ncbi:hypothetical protein [Spirosoma utsteinense]|uniref:Uncharacterized protein n=1 Tax=Spirosoma utsteinense TaxID=2585773 RepID=A0ABR6WDV0_9BACT|nr:hypothetical protein [Spirosoma utsteinense]MBC3788780.1 hypothetical protein [Spirosoma utsteinense]MBC3794733.1 hypothetical protein [Spirosoma utsteinense]